MLTIGKFQSVRPPQIEHDEDAFPGLPLETHSGTVKWVAPIQLAAGVKPETLKIEGKVNMQLCDAKGCAQPKDYPFTATLRADVQAVKVAAAQGPKERRVPRRQAAVGSAEFSAGQSIPARRPCHAAGSTSRSQPRAAQRAASN